MRIGPVATFTRALILPLLSACAALVPSSSHAVTREVCAEGCFSTTIQAAIQASAAGDVVLVHDGTYQENLDFRGKAITVRSVNGAAATAVDGGLAGPVVQFISGETSRTLLQGFTLTRGSGGWYAGGIRCDGASPRVVDCVVTGNTGMMGGGVRVFGGAPSFRNCEISANYGSYGGGVSASETAAVFTACRISGNTSTFGAGIGCFGLSSRTAPAPPEASPRFVNCVVSGNSTTAPAGCTRYPGGGLAASISSPTLVNCTFSGNYADVGAGMAAFRSAVRAVNCIFWNEAGDPLHAGTEGTFDVTSSNVQGGFGGRGNRNVDPQFVRPVFWWDAPTAAGDLRLRRTSPCIDTGTGTGAPRTDMEGQARPWGRRVDIGADEHFGGVDVCPEGCVWTSIQAAYDQARLDEVVLVGDGVYRERLRLVGRGAILESLNGPTATVVDGGGQGSTVTFSTDPAHGNMDRFRGFTVTGGTGTAVEAVTHGGGVLVEAGADASLAYCRISGNSAERGAGLAVLPGGSATVLGSMVTGNRAALEGGGLWMAAGRLVETTVSGNAADVAGGGLFVGADGTVRAESSILWGDVAAGAANEIAAPSGSAVFSDSDVAGGWPGPGMIDADPLFAAPLPPTDAPTTGGDYHLQAGSPCIDAGPVLSSRLSSDIDRDPRPASESRDIGADEFVAPGNLLQNSSLEVGARSPAGWTRSLLGSADVTIHEPIHDGTSAFRIGGDGTAKALAQSVALAGAAGDSFTLRAWMEADLSSARPGGFAGVRVRIFHRDGTVRILRLAAPTVFGDLAETTFTAPRAYRRIEVALCNSTRGGEVVFDALRLARN